MTENLYNMEKIDRPSNFDKVAFNQGKEIHKHTVQLLIEGGIHLFKPFGTGVLVFIGGKYLLLTAAHVTSITDTQNLYIILSGKPHVISGTLQETDLDKDNNIDIAYIFLDDVLSNLISKEYSFLPFNKINIAHSIVPSSQYVIFGYPARNIKEDISRQTIYTGSQVFVTSIADEEIYRNMGFDKKDHFVMNFNITGIAEETGEVVKVEDPYGISGCGLWFITASQVGDKIEYGYELIGIVKGGSVYQIVATNIRILIDGIEKLGGIVLS
jgi:hypothetical protein